MGKTDTIKKLEQQNKEFQDFMVNTVGSESEVAREHLLSQIASTVTRHYDKNGWAHSRLFGDSREDYQNFQDWSLDRINKIIEDIGNALKAGDYPSAEVPGSSAAKPDTIEQAKEFTGVFASDHTLIMARVQALVTGALSVVGMDVADAGLK
ncbi:hypothetical protein ACFVWF_33390 [Rhodococcus qingshengii]|uniref:hypothetical protein n=1 Tax=Rhodococcus qingshengii TaxID=334542 RepID=UPI0036DA26D3